MTKNFVFALYDCVSETVLQRFIASTGVQAKSMVLQMFKKNPDLNLDDFKVYLLDEFDNPFSKEDIEELGLSARELNLGDSDV